jgi:catechol 2,3-dioxygenase-like lactoylglutathione lyase family enzyme
MSTVENRPPLRGIHDLKFAVSDLDESLRFYERALGANHVPELDHTRDEGTRFAVVVEVPGLGTVLQLRLDPERAARQAMFDPLAIAVDDLAALERWDTALTQLGVLHSPILDAVRGVVDRYSRPRRQPHPALHAGVPRSRGQAGHRQPMAYRMTTGSKRER